MRISEPMRLSRRHLLATAVALAAAGPAAASATDRAVALVTGLAAELTRLVNSGRSASQLYGEFERILARYGDMAVVAASALGPPWRAASAAQKQGFVAAFQRYLSRKYGRQFSEYRNAEITVLASRDAGRAGVLVQTEVVRPGEEDVAVDWQVSERSGSAKVVNLVIEGVSMLATERAEIGAMLEAERGSLERLITRLNSWS